MLSNLYSIVPGDTDWRSRGVLLIQAKISSGRSRRKLSTEEEESLRKTKSDRLKAVGNLVCVMGSKYLVKSNTDVSKGVANGTFSCLEDIILHQSAKIRVVRISETVSVHAVYADEVKCLILKHRLGNWKKRKLFHKLPTGCFPLVPFKSSSRFRLEGTLTTISVLQFPCVLALVLTGHKVQGQTLESIIIGAISNQYKLGGQGWLYVVLSRVRTLNGLFTFVKLNSNPKCYKARTDVITEMKRLKGIERSTMDRLNRAVIFN
jgi:hypothetical protein